MKVSEEEVRQALEVLDLPVKKWNSTRLATKVANLAEVVAPCEDKLDDLSSDQRNLIDKIISANEEGEEIEFESEESEESEEDAMTTVVETKKKDKKPAKEKKAKEKATTEKPAKEKKERAGTDKFGSRVGSNAAKVNSALTAKAKSMKEIMEEVGLSGTMYNHLNKMVEKGLIEKTEDGYRLPAKAKK